MVTRTAFQQALVAHPPTNFAELVALVHTLRYTGPVTLHCIHGTATSVEIPGDVLKVRLDHPTAALTPIGDPASPA